jgi:hypothetical protein
LIAPPTVHSLSDSSHPKSSSHPLALLEKRGRSASICSSCSSVDSESNSPPEAPVLKAATIDEGGKKGQKRKRVRSDEHNLKHNEARRKVYARKRKGLEGNLVAIAAEKEKNREKSALYKTKMLESFKANPAAKSVWNAAKKKITARHRANQIAKFDGDPVAIAEFDAEKKAVAKRKRDGKKNAKKDYDSKRKEEQFAKFVGTFDDKHKATAAWELEKKRLIKIKNLKHRDKKALEKKATEDAELLMIRC